MQSKQTATEHDTLPKTMKSAFARGPGKKLEVMDVDIPTPEEGEVLIKVAYSTIDPADLLGIEGKYPVPKKLDDYVPGLEGSGTIVKVGPGALGKNLEGKKVAFFSHNKKKWGAWSEYTLAQADWIIVLPDDMDLKDAAAPLVNPMTVLFMKEECQSRGYKSIILDAANSALGKMLIRTCKSNGIKTLGIVRKDKHIEKLKECGVDVALNSDERHFEDELKKAVAELQPKGFFDSLGGDFPIKVFEDMPNESTLYSYGFLSDDKIAKIPISEFVLKDKQVQGFWLMKKIQKAGGTLQDVQFIDQLPKKLTGDLKSEFGESFPMTEINDAIKKYKKGGSGKILLECCGAK